MICKFRARLAGLVYRLGVYAELGLKADARNRFQRCCGPLAPHEPEPHKTMSVICPMEALKMLCPFCRNEIDRSGAWRNSTGQLYCSEFCAEEHGLRPSLRPIGTERLAADIAAPSSP